MITLITKSLAQKRAMIEKNEKGFTLIELLVVVLIIGVLAAIAIPIFLGQQVAARDSAVQSDITNAKTAVVAYMVANNGNIPTTLTGLSDFTPATTSNLAIQETAAGDGFCISGYDTANGATDHTFSADDKTGVALGVCTAGAAVHTVTATP